MDKTRNDFDFLKFLDDASKVVIAANDPTAANIKTLEPLAGTMAKALTQIGINPPRDLNNLAAAFNKYVVYPQTGQSSLNPEAIAAFFAGQLQKKQAGQVLTGVDKTVADGADSVLARLEGDLLSGELFKSPWFWLVVVGIIAAIYIAVK